MEIPYTAIRLADGLRAFRLSKRLQARDAWSPAQREAHQRRELAELKRHATTHSPFWRDRLASDPPPVLDKSTLMAHFDDAVSDPRLRLAQLEEHLARLTTKDEFFVGDFRVMATSGTTGERGVFVYSRAEWRVKFANAARMNAYSGIGGLWPRRRVAAVQATTPLHIGGRFSLSADIGVHPLIRCDVRDPLDETVAALSAHQPEVVLSYPSALAMLAEERVAGRLRIAPTVLITTSELRTEGMEAAIRAAWPEARLYDVYATTEGGVIAANCERRDGMHLFEDSLIFENVDEVGDPVPDGEVGAALLLTDLYARAQPKIRYAVADAVVLTSEPCPCGRTTRRVLSVAGRSDDVLQLPGRGGGTVQLHPLTIRSPMAAQSGVLQYQVVHEHDGLRALVVPRGAADRAEVERSVTAALATALKEGGADVGLRVELVDEIPRSGGHGAKTKVVRSDVSRPVAAR